MQQPDQEDRKGRIPKIVEVREEVVRLADRNLHPLKVLALVFTSRCDRFWYRIDPILATRYYGGIRCKALSVASGLMLFHLQVVPAERRGRCQSWSERSVRMTKDF